MKKVKMNGKLNLNKEMILKLNDGDMDSVKGGWTGSIGVRCTQQAGSCGGDGITKGWACNDDLPKVVNLLGGC